MPEARALWFIAPGRAELRPERLAPPGPDQVLVETLCSGVSRGSESLVFRGLVPESQHAAMRAPFQAGDFPFPIKYGYSSVGQVVEGPAGLVGRRVFCLHPHQDRYVVPAGAVLPVPDAVPDARAVLAANLETALNGVWDAGPLPGDRIAVIGAGVVGALAAALMARLPGAAVQLIDIDAGRAGLARALGVAFATPEQAAGEVDLVLHASGRGEGLALALRLAGFEASVVELSWYGSDLVQVPLGESFHSRRLTLRSSQVGAVAPARRARRTPRQRLGLALDLLADARFDALLEPPVRFRDLPERLPEILLRPGALCQVVSYDE